MGRLKIKQKANILENGNLNINTSPESKMSDLIIQYAGDFISMGENTEDRQSYLNGACTAWNIANLDEKDREGTTRKTLEGFKKINPGADDVEDFEQNLRKLIQKKLEMFPDIKKIIVDAKIEPIDKTKFQINIASTYDKELLREMFKKGSDRVIQIGSAFHKSQHIRSQTAVAWVFSPCLFLFRENDCQAWNKVI